ncbi:hypothetical protein D3C81_1777720 [compost metagenome]
MNGIFKYGFKLFVSGRTVLPGLQQKIKDRLNKDSQIVRIEARIIWQSAIHKDLKLLCFPVFKKIIFILEMRIECCSIYSCLRCDIMYRNGIEVSLFPNQLVKRLHELLTGFYYTRIIRID